MRIRLAASAFPIVLAAFCVSLAAQSNPVPFVNSPLVPATAVPGGPAFTITVNGAGFASGAVVNWNGSARATTFVSSTKVTALIPASDIVAAGTIPVTVSNPTPGGGTSNPAMFAVNTPTTSLAFNRTDTDFSSFNSGNPAIFRPSALAVGYLPLVSTPNLEIASSGCPALASCILDHGYITTMGTFLSQTHTVNNPDSLVIGDFNGDGIFDLLSLGSTYSISLAYGNGQFANPKSYPLPADANPYFTPALGDFNRDGHLDLVVAAQTGVYFLPGNGDGTFGAPVFTISDSSATGTQVVAGDFNGDGILDLAVSNMEVSGGSVSILLGNGDGTFVQHANYPFNFYPGQIAAADFNGDSKLDLGVFEFSASSSSISILLGNGDGTFQSKVNYPAGISPIALALGDYNGDGKVDIAVSDSLCTNSGCPASGSVNVLLGIGDGTFQSHLDFATQSQPGAVAAGEFIYSGSPVGRQGFAAANPSISTISIFSAVQPAANPLPTISSLSPQYVIQGSGGFTLTINGTNFVSGSVVSFGGQAEPTTFVNSNELTAAIPSTAVANVGAVFVLVTSPTPGGGNSTSAQFGVYLPPPVISSLSPSSVVAGSPSFLLIINGTNFVQDCTVDFNGVVQPFTYVSSTQLTTTVAASAIAINGTISISVTNPQLGVWYSGGGTSSPATLTILAANSQPVVGALSPASATAGGPSFTLTITGSGFGPSSIVTFGSAIVSSAYQNSSTLQASIPASAIAVAGTPLVSVKNPGGNPSVVVSFAVNNPVPTATIVSPSSVAPGSAGLTLSLTGTNFNSSSTVQLNASPRTTTFVSSTSLTAALPASDFAHSGTLNVTVSNPSPGGGTTTALQVTVPDFNVNASTSTSVVPAGQSASFTLAVAPLNGALAGTVTFTATGLPANASPSFSPATLPAGSKSTNVSLSISTAPHTAASDPRFPLKVWPQQPLVLRVIALVMALIWLGFVAARGPVRRYAPQLLVLLLLAAVSAMAACRTSTNNFSPQLNPATGTPAGTYPIIVAAVSGNASLTTNVTLTVN
jgi:hypothetical protein